MSDANAGTATGLYILDIADVERKAAQLRQLFAGIRNDAAQVSAPLGAPQITGSPAQATQQTAATNESAAALSRQALAAGDAAGAVALMDQALGKTTQSETANTTATAASTRQQAALRVALGDRIGAIELLEAALGQQVAGSAEAVAIEKQLTQVENQGIQIAQREADTTVRLAQEQARAAAATRDYAGALEILNAAKSQGGAAGAQTLAALETQIATVETAGADATVHLAQERARASVAAKDYAGALQILNVAQLEGAGASPQVSAALNTQIATVETASTVTGAFGAQIGLLVNPITLTVGGLALATKAAQSFGEALQFAGELQEERTAFGGVIGDFQRGNAILDQATARTEAYGFTAKQTTAAFRELAPVIRESTSTTQDQAEALIRISTVNPADPVNALKTAIEGIRRGRFAEIAGEMGLTKNEAKALTDQVFHGKDAFVALNEALDKHGLTLDVARTRTEGLIGKEHELEQATERRQRAQAGAAGGLGLFFTNASIAAQDALTDALSDNATAYAAVQARDEAYTRAIHEGKDATEAARLAHEAWAAAIQDTGAAQTKVGTAIQSTIAPGQQQAALIDQSNAAQRGYADSLELTGVRARAAALATEQKATSDKVAALDAQGHAIQEDNLNKIAERTAQALLLNGAAGAREAALLASSSSDLDVRTAAYYRLAVAMQAAGAGATQQQAADFRNMELFGQTAAQTTAALQKQTAAEQARSQGILQNGTAAQKIAELQRQYNDAVRQSGPASAQAILANNALVAAQQAASKTRVSAAATTGLQLAQTEETSQLAILKAQREGLERQRDQQEDFDVKKARSQEDEDKKIRRLLATGQRGAADRERADFALQQKRGQEDFDREKRRTVRNNAESTGDIDARTDLRQSQIGDRAALRGVRPAGGAPSNLPPPPFGVPNPPPAATQPIIVRLQIQPVSVQIDGHQIVEFTWPEIEQRVDAELADAIRSIQLPPPNQTAIAGPTP